MVVGDTHVFPGFLTPVLTQLFFPKPPTTFLTCFCRGERRKYAKERKVALTRHQTHNHQVMSPIRSPQSHPGGAHPRLEQADKRSCDLDAAKSPYHIILTFNNVKEAFLKQEMFVKHVCRPNGIHFKYNM